MRVRVFGATERNYSIDRYTRELVSHFPPEVDAQAVHFECSRGVYGRVIDRYFRYARCAGRNRGDINIITSEVYSHLLFALPRNRTLVVCHDTHPLRSDVPRGFKVTGYRARYYLSLQFLRAAFRVVTVSENTRRELLAHCPFLDPAKVVTILSGLGEEWSRIEDETTIERVRADCGLRNRPFLLNVGNDVWYKNLAGAIEGFAHAPCGDLVFVHVGSVSSASRALIEKNGIADRFRHLQDVSDETLRVLYSTAGMLLFPSISEGFGWPPLEAMACGCPVVASDRGSLPEVCGNAALLVDPHEPASIARAICDVLQAPQLRADLVMRGREQAQRFSWNRTAKGMLELFQAG